MKDDVSRRNFVALGSAAAAISVVGCTSAKSQSTDVQPNSAIDLDKLDIPFEMRGEFPSYGENPNGPPSYEGKPLPLPAFEPEYIAIVHIRSDKPWLFDINHAHFSVSKTATAGQRLARAIYLIEKKGISKTFGNINTAQDKPFKRTKPPYVDQLADYIDFAKIGFGSKHELFIYFDHPNVRFKTGHLITFAPKTYTGAEASENHAYFDANVVLQKDMATLKNKGRMIRLRNYYTGPNGAPLAADEATETIYAMNIHFEAKLDGINNFFVPMVIDPDTGNGSGNEP